jgi:hypothetical protein
LLRVSTWTIRRYIANGQIPAVQLGGKENRSECRPMSCSLLESEPQ